MSKRGSFTEFGLIEKIKKSAVSRPDVVCGIGDDTAVLDYSASKYLLMTTDMMAEGVHFTKRIEPRSIGHKALACNISDIAAMGGIPTHAVVSIALPPKTSARFVKDVYAGINALARRFKVSVVGGDTISSRQFVINITLLGEVEKKNLVLRSGARDGDWIFVTGSLGRSWKSDRHVSFTPRVEEARFLVSRYKPSAMIDISDGLAGDLGHILKQSRVGGVLVADQIPLNPKANVENALCDGEDFELAFTLSDAQSRKLVDWQLKSGRWFFYPIGVITRSKDLKLMTADGRITKISSKGYSHF